tara:strand:+ start:467 stop:796 length:330 start_codon:yes stop_codon:yes gene_type:complete
MKRVYCFWESILISKFDYQDKNELFKVGKDLIEQALRTGHSLSHQKKIYRGMLDSLSFRKKNKRAIWNSDHQLGIGAMMALIIMKDIPLEDDPTCGLYFPPTPPKGART